MSPASDVAAPATLTSEAQLAALARSPVLSALGPEQHRRILEHAELVSFPIDAPVLVEGAPAEEMFFLLEGEAGLTRHGAPIRALLPGDFFGALGLLTSRPRLYSVRAHTPLWALRISRTRYEHLAAAEPLLVLSLVRALFLNLREELTERDRSTGRILRERTSPRAHEVEVNLGATTKRVPTGTPLRMLLPAKLEGRLVVAGLLGQKPVSLDTQIFADTTVAPLTADHWEGRQVYVRSVGLLLLEAAHRIAPELTVRMGPSRGTVQVVEIAEAASLDREAFAEALHAEMQRLARHAVRFRQEHWAVEEAVAYFQERGWTDAVHLVRARASATVALVSCGEIYANGLGPLLPEASDIRGFHLRPHEEGLLIDYGHHDPRSTNGNGPGSAESGGLGNGSAKAFTAALRGEMAREHRGWLESLGVTSVGALSDFCVTGQVSQLIRIAEGFHEKRIGQIADAIAARKEEVRLICIAGPSSSGKTTFIKRLRVQLQINGLNPRWLSLDDYYVDRVRNPRDESGEYDFEALEALDLGLLQEQVSRLLAGEELKTARYDFKTGTSHPRGGALVSMQRGDILMMEGIHGLNPRLLGDSVERELAFRVFVHPATTLPFDRLTRVSATDIRLLRRIVRDRHGRGHNAAANILRWPSVQAGEQKHIFPYQGEADVHFDSSLIYELAVLKVYAERYLLEVPTDSPAYGTAYRLRHLVDRFVAIYPDHVPPTSLLREFIGGSGFEF